MTEKNDFLSISKYIRPGTIRTSTKGGVIHWVAKPMQPAWETRKYWEDRVSGKNGFGSAHDIVDVDGSVLHCVPSNEVAYHCGATSPVAIGSTVYYSEIARARWPEYTMDYEHKSPNSILIGIEFEHRDWSGKPTEATEESLVALMIGYSKQFSFPSTEWFTHKQIVEYKDCPHWYNVNPNDWARLIDRVSVGLGEK